MATTTYFAEIQKITRKGNAYYTRVVSDEYEFTSAEAALAWGHAQKLKKGEKVAYSRYEYLYDGYWGLEGLYERDGKLFTAEQLGW